MFFTTIGRCRFNINLFNHLKSKDHFLAFPLQFPDEKQTHAGAMRMDLKTTLGDMVAFQPLAARVLSRYQLDYCCGGRQTLEEASQDQGLDPRAILAEIEAEKADDLTEEPRWDRAPLPALIDHIVHDYHQPLREELARLVALAKRVEVVHAGKEACPAGLAAHLELMQEALLDHLAKEEQSLFPMARANQIEWLQAAIGHLGKEHEDVGADLRRTRELTGYLLLPEEACASWRELYTGLEHLEAELMAHVHLENNILFPRLLSR
jgi:regulator of cell morphogenesis and NO signaling